MQRVDKSIFTLIHHQATGHYVRVNKDGTTQAPAMNLKKCACAALMGLGADSAAENLKPGALSEVAALRVFCPHPAISLAEVYGLKKHVANADQVLLPAEFCMKTSWKPKVATERLTLAAPDLFKKEAAQSPKLKAGLADKMRLESGKYTLATSRGTPVILNQNMAAAIPCKVIQ